MASDINLLVANTKAFYPVTTMEFAKAVELQELFERERQVLQTLTVKSTASTTSSTNSSGMFTFFISYIFSNFYLTAVVLYACYVETKLLVVCYFCL